MIGGVGRPTLVADVVVVEVVVLAPSRPSTDFSSVGEFENRSELTYWKGAEKILHH